MSNVTLTGFYAGYLFADNNSTLTNIGTVSTGYYGMSVTGSGDTVVNAGLIAGDVYDGLVFKGSVVNQLGGTISGGRYGVASSTAVAIDNAGTIIGTAKAGAYLQANSTVTNQSTGIILGGGVGISAGSGTAIDNAGTIYGVGKAGIDIGPSGFIANRSGGTISGGHYGIAAGSNSTIDNAGSIGGIDIGAYLQGDSSVTNQSGGIVSGYTYALYLTHAGTIVNAGTVAGAHRGIQLNAGGSVTNQSGGTIASSPTYTDSRDPDAAIYGVAGPTYIDNAGMLDSGAIAVFIGSGSLLLNRDTGIVHGYYYGVATHAGATIDNAGTILADATGILSQFGGVSIFNRSTGTIAGYRTGIYASRGGNVVNDGRISGNRSAVFADIGTTITNTGSGVLTSTNYAAVVDIDGFLTNAGTLDGTQGGAYLERGGTIVNLAGGIVNGGTYGIVGDGPTVGYGINTIENAGTVTGTAVGVRFDTNGTIVNAATGTISGAIGIKLGGLGALTNQGLIVGTAGDGVLLYGGASLTNQATGTISTVHVGTSASAVSLRNEGTIGNGTIAVALDNNTVDNRVAIAPGAVFLGSVTGGTGVLELVSGASAGTLTGLGSQYSGFSTVTIDTDATWVVSDSIGSGYTLADSGTLINAATLGSKVTLTTGAVLTNLSAGIIAAGTIAVHGEGSATVDNAGYIIGTTRAGVYLDSGGSVVNRSGGTLTGGSGIEARGTTTVVNDGTIAGRTTIGGYHTGLYLDRGTASVTNNASGIISGFVGIKGYTEALTIVNSGSIGGVTTATQGYGIYIRHSLASSVTNLSSGIIDGYIGIFSHATLTLTNSGTIRSSGGAANIGVIAAGANSVITNLSTGTISGATGMQLSDTTTLVNSGLVEGTGAGNYGAWLIAGGSVVNLAQGTISTVRQGGSAPATTVFNAGTIGNGTYAIGLTSGQALDRLILAPGAVVLGSVDGGTGVLELASGASTGTLTGFGAQFADFTKIEVDANSNWLFDGDNTVASGIVITDAGTLINAATLGSRVTLTAGAALTNQSAGIISATGVGVLGQGTVAVDNAGAVYGYTTGIYLPGGGSIVNESTGTISTSTTVTSGFGGDGIATRGDTTVVNAGRIVTSRYGVVIAGTGSVSNQSGGTIGGQSGILAYAATTTVTNAGQIDSTGGHGGIWFLSGGSVSNTTSGAISAASLGILSYGTASVVNAGSIYGFAQAVHLNAGGSVTNQSTGILSTSTTVTSGGGGNAIQGYGAVTVVNAGIIQSSRYAVVEANGGIVTNLASGTIAGGARGVSIGGGTVINAGTISGGFFSVVNSDGAAFRLAIAPDAVFSGVVEGGNTVGSTATSTIELASGASTGTLTSLGSQFINFTQIEVDAGATWVLDSSDTVVSGVTLTNAGTLSTGATLAGGAILHNLSTGTIAGGNNAVVANGMATVVNAGSLDGAINGVKGVNGVDVTNQSGGIITGGFNGIGEYQAGTVVNAGLIQGNRFSGVDFEHGGVLTNASTGTVVGGGGVYAGSTSTIVNAGLIAGYTAIGAGYGIFFVGDGSLTNQSQGTIQGDIFGVELGGVGTVVNAGSIGGGTIGLKLLSDGRVVAGGTISGGTIGIAAYGSTTIVASGTISGGVDAVQMAGGAAQRLAIAPDAVFSGVVDGGNTAGSGAVSTIELTSGASTGTLTSIGSQFVGFTSIDIDANSHWIVDGAIGAAYTVDNAGTLNNAGTTGVALTLGSNDFVTNRSGGTIVGSNKGIDASFGGTVSNAGSIGGIDVGVDLYIGGSVVNTTGGRISGSSAIDSQGTATAVDNAGSIDATNIAIRLGNGGSVTNQASGVLSGTRFGIASYVTASVTNSGTIVGTTYAGIFLVGGGMLTNTGAILGTTGAATAGPSTVVNAGIIAGTATATVPGYSTGLFLHGSTDSATNQSSGTISGYIGVEAINNLDLDNSGRILGDLTHLYGAGVFAVYTSAATASIVNRAGGTISGFTGVEGQGAVSLTNSGVIVGGSTHRAYGAFLATSGSFLTNLSGGTLSGSIGALIGTGSTIVNSGKIAGNVLGDNYGILAFTGGAITNLSTGIIDNIATGPTGSTTIFNAGTIGDGTTAIGSNHNTIANRIAVAPGAVFLGSVNGGNGVLEFTSSATTGTIAGLGSKYQNFSALDIDAGAHWTLGGDNTIAFGVTVETGGTLTLNNSTFADTGTLVNNGGIVLDPSTMVVGNLLGSGTITIQAGSTLEVAGSIASTETIVFAGDHAYLHLDDPTNAHGVIVGFDNTDRIDLVGIDPGSVSYAAGNLYFGVGGTLSVTTAGGNPLQTVVSADGTEVTALCFLPDTLIETPDGQVKVQDLKTGDIVTTFSGAHRPISWIGTGSVLATRGKRGPATPVIVRKHALGHGMPFYDLRVTKGHSFLLDGVLIPVEFLVNHRTIEWDDRAREVTLYHVELETHDILIANGAPAESYRDDGNRWLFQNANSGWDQPAKEPCAPVLTGGPIVDAVWRRLLERASDRPGLPMTEEPDIHLLVDGVRVDGTCFDDGRRQFEIFGSHSEIRIVSRAGAPAEFGLSRDPRVLGIAIRALRCWQGPKLRVIGADDAALRDGFHAYEAEQGFRWTTGDALVPPELAAGVVGPWQLDIVVASTARYPLLREDSLAA